MNVGKLRNLLNDLVPESTQLDWDNSGFLVGDSGWDATRAYIALDCTDEVISRAIDSESNVIITHHPLIFDPRYKVNDSDYVGKRVLRLIENRIALISLHTNFDKSGMRSAIDAKMGLAATDILDPADGIGSYSSLGPNQYAMPNNTTLLEYASFVKRSFGLTHVLVYGNRDHKVTRVAVCGGSGKSEVENAIKSGADVYVTGDIDHHTALDCVEKGLAVIDAGHYGLEHVFIDYIADHLSAVTGELDIIKDPYEEPGLLI